MKIGVFAGTFDPFTLGHYSVVMKAIDLFDEIHIVLANNPDKTCMFNQEIRKKICQYTFKDEPKIRVVVYDGLIIDYCKEVGSSYMIRGIRGSSDFGYENMICHANKLVNSDIETVYFMTDSKYIGISSSIVRELIKNKHYDELGKFMHSNVDLIKLLTI